MIRKVIVVAVVLFPTASVHASDWREIYTGENETVFIDAQSSSKNGSSASVWLRQDLKREQVAATGQDHDKLMDHVAVDCKSWKASTLSSIGLSHGQESIKFQVSGFEDVTPDTYLSKAAEIVCNGPDNKPVQ